MGTCYTLMNLKHFWSSQLLPNLIRPPTDKFVQEKTGKDDLCRCLHSFAYSYRYWEKRERYCNDGQENRFGKMEWKGIRQMDRNSDWRKGEELERRTGKGISEKEGNRDWRAGLEKRLMRRMGMGLRKMDGKLRLERGNGKGLERWMWLGIKKKKGKGIREKNRKRN